MIRSGTADLPLHNGKVPVWLAERMTRIGCAITEIIISEYGVSHWLSRMSDPFWFQSLGCVMGMDWHSSGITTSVMGALKRGLNPRMQELGIAVCGGRGAVSRQTPTELVRVSEKFGTSANMLIKASRLSAKVDNTCIQDGFQIYLHTCLVSRTGEWAVIQQGMNNATGMARRYHWHSPRVTSFVADPHSGIAGENQGEIINISDARAHKSREAILEFMHLHPDLQKKELKALGLSGKNQQPAVQYELFPGKEPAQERLTKLPGTIYCSNTLNNHLTMPLRHEVKSHDVRADRLGAVLALAYESDYKHFSDALLIPGLGPRTMQSLALVSEILYGAPSRFTDPARFSFAHGGKDGHPFPVPVKTYDETIQVLEQALKRAPLQRSERFEGLKRLSQFSKVLEQTVKPIADVDQVIAVERAQSPAFGGKTVWGNA